MVPPIIKARRLKVDLQLSINEFLRLHGKADDAFALEPHDAVLRQKNLPADAKILYAYLEEDDAETNQALRDAAALLNNQRAGLIVSDAEVDALNATVERIIHAPPARNLIVVVGSEKWKAVERGHEPWHTGAFDYAAFFPPQQEGAKR